MHNGLLHLIARKAARNKNAAEEIIDVQLALPCKLRKKMNIESVAAIDHSNRRALRQSVCRHLQREQKYRLVAIQEICFARGSGEMLNECLIWR